mgnify:CR=1 FL=1
MIVKLFFIIVICLLSVNAEAQQDNTNKTPHNPPGTMAIRFGGFHDENVLQTLGGKYWLKENIAISMHLSIEYDWRYQYSPDPNRVFYESRGFVGIMVQGEYHLHSINNIISINKDISPYVALSIGSGIELSGSWYTAAGIALGAEVFLQPSISLALEQGLDISYKHQEIYETTARFRGFLQFAKLLNHRLLFHIYF